MGDKLCETCKETDQKKFYNYPGKPKNRCKSCCKKAYNRATKMKRLDLEYRKKQAKQLWFGIE